MKIGYLGAGTWGYCLARLLATKGYDVVQWDINKELIECLTQHREHPKMPGFPAPDSLTFTTSIEKALIDKDMIVEGVTSAGMRSVCDKIQEHLITLHCPLVLTSKGIEQHTCLLMPEVAEHVLGSQSKEFIVCLSGPSHAEEVIKGFPTSVVCAGYNRDVEVAVRAAFMTPEFRIYLNNDIRGVAFGGAMKNIIAIASGISDGLGFGDNTKAALMTRGLHEIRKLSVSVGCNSHTLVGLSGMGDLCVTCLSTLSRNYRFGKLVAEGLSSEQAQQKIGMVVEGAYTCLSAMQLSKKIKMEMPITTAVAAIIYDNVTPKDAVYTLLSRIPKDEEIL